MDKTEAMQRYIELLPKLANDPELQTDEFGGGGGGKGGGGKGSGGGKAGGGGKKKK